MKNKIKTWLHWRYANFLFKRKKFFQLKRLMRGYDNMTFHFSCHCPHCLGRAYNPVAKVSHEYFGMMEIVRCADCGSLYDKGKEYTFDK